jgi:DNA-binding response OmpR family regulator
MILNADRAFLELMREFLSEEGYDVRILSEDNAAFEAMLAEKPRLVMIELVITDPEAGLMVLHKMRLHPKTARIPVTIASTITQLIRDNEEHLQSKAVGLECGVGLLAQNSSQACSFRNRVNSRSPGE